jgi:hypothetical protein
MAAAVRAAAAVKGTAAATAAVTGTAGMKGTAAAAVMAAGLVAASVEAAAAARETEVVVRTAVATEAVAEATEAVSCPTTRPKNLRAVAALHVGATPAGAQHRTCTQQRPRGAPTSEGMLARTDAAVRRCSRCSTRAPTRCRVA